MSTNVFAQGFGDIFPNKASQIKVSDPSNYYGSTGYASPPTTQSALMEIGAGLIGGGSGDVTGVGDCTSGACFDGTSDGGTSITFYHLSGSASLSYDNTKHDFRLLDDLDIEELHPHLNFRDITDNTAYEWYLDTTGDNPNFSLFRGTDTGTGFAVANGGIPLLRFDNNNNLYINGVLYTGGGGATYTASGTLLQLSGTVFSVKEGTLTTTKGCRYVAGTGIVCDQTYLTAETDPTVDSSAEIQTIIGAGVYQSTLTNSAGLLAALNDETGTGLAVFNTNPTLAGANFTSNAIFALNQKIGFTYYELTKYLGYDSTRHDFVFTDDVDIDDTDPHLSWRDTDDNSATEVHFNNTGDYAGWALFHGTNTGSGFTIGSANAGYPSIWVDTSYNVKIPYSNFYVGANRIPDECTRCAYVEDLVAADDNKSLGAFAQAVTITGIGCAYSGTGTTKATLTLEDGSGNAMTITGTNPTCVAEGTDFTFAPVTAGNTLNVGEIVRFDTTNTTSPLTDDYTICLKYRIN